jgi:peptidoglycan/LPS O-acetylase OafA/YrhL
MRHFRSDIEGLRAVAILFVVLYHAGMPWTDGGYRGVDVFFVLSGFLITSLLVDEVERTGTISLTDFWARRARRLLPEAAVVTIVVLILDTIWLTPFDQIEVAKSIRAFAVYASNISFAIDATDYFGGGGTHQPILHTWSLSVEEQFYLVFAPLLLGLAAWSAKSAAGRTAEPDCRAITFRRRFFMTAIILTVVSYVGWLALEYKYPVNAFFYLHARMWELGVGVLSVFIATRRRDADLIRSGVARESLAVLALVVLLVSAVVAKSSTGTFGLAQLISTLTTLATAALILSSTPSAPTMVARLLSTSPMRLLGRLSYGWYLWHWPVIVFLKEVVPNPSLTVRLLASGLALIPAAITYQWVTGPIRFSSYLQRRPKIALAGAVALTGMVAAAATVAIVRVDRLLAAPMYAPLMASKVLPAVHDNGCHLSVEQVEMPACEFGRPRTDTTVVLFGDSHAAQWFPALDSIAVLRGWRLISLTKSACPSADVTLLNGQLGRRYDECNEWRQRMIARIVGQRPTLIVLANTRTYNILSGDRKVRTDANPEAQRLWSQGLHRTLVQLGRSQARIVVFQNNPHPGFDVPNCKVAHMTDSRCDHFTIRRVDTVLAPVERASVRGVPNTTYVNLNDLLCDGGECFTVRDGVVRYLDSNHISVPYARSLAPALSAVLTRELAAR